ncbi:MAG: hypothetical protein HY744_00140 [Deltaproteobacteria bacterium]|nr:hypothetical protein [Deltaproteobacteria bacterium]
MAEQRSPWRIAALSLVVLATAGGSGLREDELECEQAAAHLLRCCPTLHPGALACQYETGCGPTVETTFSVPESQCIQSLSCEQIDERRLCERVADLDPPVVHFDDGGTESRYEVCP